MGPSAIRTGIGANGIRGAQIVAPLGLELLQSFGGEAISADRAPSLRGGPVGLEPAADECILEGGIQRPLFDTPEIARQLANPWGNDP